jgi:hypothetical protein
MTNRNLILLTIYAAAMALLESAVVVYMRRLYYPDDPLSIFPMQFLDEYDSVVEISREAATIVMLLTVALLVERSSGTRRFAAFVFVFGVWDLFYYAWLKVFIGWPRSWFEWDVLFLIPVVWLGPWICPAFISLLFIVWGYWTLRSNEKIAFSTSSLSVFALGAALGLITFFQPAMGVLARGGVAELSRYTPGAFWWWLFVPSLMLMTCGLGMTLRVARLDGVMAQPASAS